MRRKIVLGHAAFFAIIYTVVVSRVGQQEQDELACSSLPADLPVLTLELELRNSFQSAAYCAARAGMMLAISIVVCVCQVSLAILHVTVSTPLLSSFAFAAASLALLITHLFGDSSR